MANAELLKIWQGYEDNYNLKGWDFSCVAEKWEHPNPPWDYRMVVKSYLRDTDVLLDMGTGGGEVLLTIGHPNNNTYATEAYVPNFELCQNTLSPLGITVKQTFGDDKLPFGNECFDFIINRHESFDLTEINRTLKHGGYFFTQQVGNQNFSELEIMLNDDGDTHSPTHTIDNFANALTNYGFQTIIKDEAKYPVKIFDIEAVIFYSKACPWNIQKFSVETHFEKLLKIQREIDERGYFQVTEHRFMLAAHKRRIPAVTAR